MGARHTSLLHNALLLTSGSYCFTWILHTVGTAQKNTIGDISPYIPIFVALCLL